MSLVIICTYVFIRYTCIIFAFLTAQYYELNARKNLYSKFASFEQYNISSLYTTGYIAHGEE